MKQLLAILLLCSASLTSCFTSNGVTNIQPKTGSIDIPASGEYRMWKDLPHGSFTVRVTNSSPNQSVELYTVKSDGNEKWVRPSLLANSSLDVSIPADGHLFTKNFNDHVFTITYTIIE